MSSRYVYAIAAILTLSAGYGCWCRAPLIWDGAYQFCDTLANQQPYVYTARFHTYFLWWPTVWASHLTSNPKILQAVYGLPFLMAPVAGLLISWWIVRKHAPNLIIWVIFGVAIATLPGQIFVINDSIFILHLFWPIFVGLFVPLDLRKGLVLSVLAMFQFVHPLGAVLFLGAAVAAALVALVDRGRRRDLLMGSGVMLALCLLALLKLFISKYVATWHDTYIEEQFKWEIALAQWRNGVMPWLGGLQWMYAAAAMVFFQGMLRRRLRYLAPVALLAALGMAGYGAHFWWELVKGPRNIDEGVWWTGSIDYRRWVGPLAVPFFLLLTMEVLLDGIRKNAAAARLARSAGFYVAALFLVGAGFALSNDFYGVTVACVVIAIAAGEVAWRTPEGGEPSPAVVRSPWLAPRAPIGLALATIFLVILGKQYKSWDYETTRLMAQVESYQPSVIAPQLDYQFEWTWCTPCNHWATNNYVAVMQGKQPTKMFANAQMEKMLRDDDEAIEYKDDLNVRLKKKLHNPPVHRCWYYPTEGKDNDLRMAIHKAGWFDFGPFLDQLDREGPPTQKRRAEKYP